MLHFRGKLELASPTEEGGNEGGLKESSTLTEQVFFHLIFKSALSTSLVKNEKKLNKKKTEKKQV